MSLVSAPGRTVVKETENIKDVLFCHSGKTGYLFNEEAELTSLLRLVAASQDEGMTGAAVNTVSESFSLDVMVAATQRLCGSVSRLLNR